MQTACAPIYAALRGLLVSVVVAVSVAGCASHPDPALSALRDSPPRAGATRLVVLYPGPLIGTDGMVQIKWNDVQSCDLKSGSYVIRETPPGDEFLVFSFCGLPGVSALKFKAVAGKTYYIRIRPYDSSLVGILSGYPTEFPSKDAPVHKGPFEIERLDERQALLELRSLASGPAAAR